jgi:hypothetical protein
MIEKEARYSLELENWSDGFEPVARYDMIEGLEAGI